jgi:acyl dehydratase
VEGRTGIEFSLEDIDEFAAASHDKNPLHVSSAYARKTPYGERVVHGVLGTLACLGRLERQPDCELANLSVDFPAPMFAGVSYDLKATESV